MITKESEAWRWLANYLVEDPAKLKTCLCFSVDSYLWIPDKINFVLRDKMRTRAEEHVQLLNESTNWKRESAYAYDLHEGDSEYNTEARILAAYWMALEAKEEEKIASEADEYEGEFGDNPAGLGAND